MIWALFPTFGVGGVLYGSFWPNAAALYDAERRIFSLIVVPGFCFCVSPLMLVPFCLPLRVHPEQQELPLEQRGLS